MLVREPIAERPLISYPEIRTTVFGYYHTESEAAPSLVPVYKEWLIPPNNIGFLHSLLSLLARATRPVSLSYRTIFLCSTARGYHRHYPLYWRVTVAVVGNIDSLLLRIPSSYLMTLPSILVRNHASWLRTLFLVIQEQFPRLGAVFLLRFSQFSHPHAFLGWPTVFVVQLKDSVPPDASGPGSVTLVPLAHPIPSGTIFPITTHWFQSLSHFTLSKMMFKSFGQSRQCHQCLRMHLGSELPP